MAVAALPRLRRHRDPLAVRHSPLVRACALTVRAARSARRRTARTAVGATMTAALGTGTAVDARAVLTALVVVAVAAFLVGAGWVWRGRVQAPRIARLQATVDRHNEAWHQMGLFIARCGAETAALWQAERERHQPKRRAR